MLLLLDFDGTLVPIRDEPEAIELSSGTRRALARLVRHPRITAGIISGRRRDNLISHVRVPGLQYWGSFGWERRGGWMLPKRVRPLLARAHDEVMSKLEDVPGVRFEDKGIGFAVHVRGAGQREKRIARRRLMNVIARYTQDLHVMAGTEIWNILPRQITGKARAVRDAMNRARSAKLAFYLGDDATDEPAFQVLGKGISVRVGADEPTKARYRLADPNEVRSFIERLESELS